MYIFLNFLLGAGITVAGLLLMVALVTFLEFHGVSDIWKKAYRNTFSMMIHECTGHSRIK